MNKVESELHKICDQFPRREIIRKSLENNGYLLKLIHLMMGKIVDIIAPEHLELSVDKPRELMSKINNAGAVFLGRFCPEVFGDYCAGSNHVSLPLVQQDLHHH